MYFFSDLCNFLPSANFGFCFFSCSSFVFSFVLSLDPSVVRLVCLFEMFLIFSGSFFMSLVVVSGFLFFFFTAVCSENSCDFGALVRGSAFRVSQFCYLG